MNHIRTLAELNEVGIDNVDMVDVFKQGDDLPSKLDTELVIVICDGHYFYANPTSELFYDYVRDDNGGFTNSHYIYDIEGRFADSGDYFRWKKIDGGTAYIAYRKEENEPVITEPVITEPFDPDKFYTVEFPRHQHKSGKKHTVLCGDCASDDIEWIIEVRVCGDYGKCAVCGHVVSRPVSKRNHISSIKIKTADTLSAIPLKDDSYHNNIGHSARKMVDLGLGHWVYTTQWGSGSTVWRSPCDRFGGHLDIVSGTFKR